MTQQPWITWCVSARSQSADDCGEVTTKTRCVCVFLYEVQHHLSIHDSDAFDVNLLKRLHTHTIITSCARGDTICPRPSPPPVGAQAPRAPPSRRKVAVLFHAENVPTLTAAAALRVKAALSKTAWWPLIFWPWKWCPSHVRRGLPLSQF